MQIAGFVNTLVTTYFIVESFSNERESWGVIDNVQNLQAKKNYSVGHHETWETHSKMSFPGIVFIINSFRHRIELVFNKAS